MARYTLTQDLIKKQKNCMNSENDAQKNHWESFLNKSVDDWSASRKCLTADCLQVDAICFHANAKNKQHTHNGMRVLHARSMVQCILLNQK